MNYFRIKAYPSKHPRVFEQANRPSDNYKGTDQGGNSINERNIPDHVSNKQKFFLDKPVAGLVIFIGMNGLRIPSRNLGKI
jgi:hypothetical protein